MPRRELFTDSQRRWLDAPASDERAIMRNYTRMIIPGSRGARTFLTKTGALSDASRQLRF